MICVCQNNYQTPKPVQTCWHVRYGPPTLRVPARCGLACMCVCAGVGIPAMDAAALDRLRPYASVVCRGGHLLFFLLLLAIFALDDSACCYRHFGTDPFSIL